MLKPKRKGKAGGFASMDPERLKEVNSKAGKAAHESGKAYKLNSETARAAVLARWAKKKQGIAQPQTRDKGAAKKKNEQERANDAALFHVWAKKRKEET